MAEEIVKKAVAEKPAKTDKDTAKPKAEFKPGNRKYIYAIGRRKEASAQIRLYPKGTGTFVINDKTIENYFQQPGLVDQSLNALILQNLRDTFDATVHVTGGGKKGQSDAIRLGISRALIEHDESLRGQIKKLGFLTRDARVKERKKPGLRKARRAPQWSKR
jgi:small subunit ribosomal protein S9